MIKKCNWCSKKFEITEKEKSFCSLECRNKSFLYREEHKIEIKNYDKKYKKSHIEESKEYSKNYLQEHKEERNEYNKIYYKEHKEEKQIYDEKYRLEHKEQIKKWYQNNKENQKKYKSEHKQETNKNRQNKYQTDLSFKILCSLRNRMTKVLKGINKSAHTMKLVGCSIDFLKQHLEKQFKSGMTWKNYGDWHLDHIRPCASFDLRIPEQQKIAFHYLNLQPLWAKDNLSKGAKIT